MEETGFSIKCPHCDLWTDCFVEPREFVLDSFKEFKEIIDGIDTKGEEYANRKLLQCISGELCAAPFKALICASNREAEKYARFFNTASKNPGFTTKHTQSRRAFTFVFCRRRQLKKSDTSNDYLRGRSESQ